MRKPENLGLVRFPSFLSMIGVDAVCWTSGHGKENVSPVNGPVWQMLQSNTTGALHRNIALRAFAMDQRTVSGTEWVNRGQFLIKAVGQIMMKDGWMISVQRIVMLKSK